MLKNYKEILDKAKSASFEALSIWYSLRMKEDPFASQTEEHELDYFVDREDIVNSIVYDVGVASRGIPMTDLIVGPAGSGKTAILRYIKTVLERLRQEYPGEYLFKGELVSTDYLYQVEASEGEDDIETVQPWIKKSKESRDFLFIDDVKPEGAKNIVSEFMNTKLKVLAVSASDYIDVYARLPMSPKAYFLGPISLSDSIQMLDKRMKRVSTDKDREISILDYFEEEALSTIHTCSFGVPRLLLKCASDALRLLRNLYTHHAPTAAGESQKVTKEIAENACRMRGCLQAYFQLDKISRIKREVLDQVLNRPKSPTEVSSTLKKDRTTISRHLTDLKEIGLVQLETRGRESMYLATDAVKTKVEIELMPRGE